MKVIKAISRDTMEYWAFAAQVVGAAAVVLSLIYLGVQIQENTKLLRSQAHYNALSIGQRPLEMVAADQSLADLMETCSTQPETVSGSQWSRCSQLMFILFNAYEYAYYQYRDRSVPDQYWAGVDQYVKQMLAPRAGYKRFWDEYRIAFAEPFRTYVSTAVFRPAKTTTDAPPK